MVTGKRISVRVGSGGSAHIFEAHLGSDVKLHTLRDGGSVWDYVLCGVGGELVVADDDLPMCKSCERVSASTG